MKIWKNNLFPKCGAPGLLKYNKAQKATWIFSLQTATYEKEEEQEKNKHRWFSELFTLTHCHSGWATRTEMFIHYSISLHCGPHTVHFDLKWQDQGNSTSVFTFLLWNVKKFSLLLNYFCVEWMAMRDIFVNRNSCLPDERVNSYKSKHSLTFSKATPESFPGQFWSTGLVFITHCPTMPTHEDCSETFVNRF